MIKLVNVSKYYHGEGTVTQALHKINLELNIGEFVAITGESGSGKSTLLNVIAGIDSYEEGELYINNEETSHYDEEDFEKYRKEKIGFIFQNYNLIDSYTVLKNVEVALVIQGVSRKERIKKAKEIIEKVGLTSHIRHKAAKLSGGQKQRLAIARALAKDVDIIVADEPTGNLDSKSGEQIIQLLNEISKDKLVIIVTHNYEQVKDYVTRKIRLFDGEIVEDKKIREKEEVKVEARKEKANNEVIQSMQIASFNIFGQPRRSIFIFLVSFAVIAFVFFMFSSLKSSFEDLGFDYSFDQVNMYPERMIVSRKDKKPLTNNDYNLFASDSRIDKIIIDDYFLNETLYFYLEKVYFSGRVLFNLEIDEETFIGRLPEDDDEVLLNLNYNQFTIDEVQEQVIDKYIKFYLMSDYRGETYFELKVVGVNKATSLNQGFVMTDSGLNKLIDKANKNGSIILRLVDDKGLTITNQFFQYKVDDYLSGYSIKTSQYDYFYNNLNAFLYYKDQKLNYLFDTTDYDVIYISNDLLNDIIANRRTQFTLNLKNVNDRKAIERDLYNKGYYSYMPYFEYKSQYNFDAIYFAVLKTLSAIGIIFITFIIYLISYLIYRLILNTKIKDYVILRVIGGSKSLICNTIRFELIISNILAYILFFIIYQFIKTDYPFLKNLEFSDYVLLFLINIGLALLVARRFINKQVRKSLYTTLRLE